MKRLLLLKFITLTVLMTILGCTENIQKNEKLTLALNDTTITIRGNIVKISENEFRFDYYDTHEKDSYMKTLQEMNYQGVGDSWAGIVYGAIKLTDQNLLNEIRFDPESEGLAIWSNNEESLLRIGRLIAIIKSDEKVFLDCIDIAKRNWEME